MVNSVISAKELKGVYTALITPMFVDGIDSGIDYQKAFMLIDDQINSGVRGIVAAGTTGQSATLSPEEHLDFVKKIYEYISENHKNAHFIAGAGSNSTREALSFSREIERAIGPTTLLHVTGYYNNPPQEGIYRHFMTLAEGLSGSNIIMYNVPGRTKSEISPDTIIELSNHPNIIGVKQAIGDDFEKIKTVINQTDSSRFVTLSGEDSYVADILELGGFGVISASANVAPRYFVRIVDAGLNGDFRTARCLQDEVNPLVEGVFLAKNPIPLAHIFNTGLRLPLVKVSGIGPKLESILGRYSSSDLGVNLDKYRN